MTAGTELAPRVAEVEGVSAWRLRGKARIDDRDPVRCWLVIMADGSWYAEMVTFTLAGSVDLFFEADGGGHFCGPAAVGRSRADSSLQMSTALIGTGPLLVVAPDDGPLALPDAEMVDGEVVEE